MRMQVGQRSRGSSGRLIGLTRQCCVGRWRTERLSSWYALVVVLAIVPMFMVIGKNFVPEDDRSAFEVSIRAPEGTSLASSINIATQVARDIRTLDGVTDTLTNVGGSGEVNSTGIYVKLDPRKIGSSRRCS